MSFRNISSLTLLALALASSAKGQQEASIPASPVTGAAAEDSGQQALHYKTYRVEMTTRGVIPDNKKVVSELRVWHALPTKRPWSGTTSEVGASDIHFTPSGGAQEHEKKYNSDFIVWRGKEVLAPGTPFSFTTSYTVRSADREFKPGAVRTQWPAGFQPPLDIEPELARIADVARARLDPASAVLEFSKWIKSNIRYDASVAYRATDVASTVANHRGHCGHIYWTFAQMCRRVGIPVRPVRGLNLFAPGGESSLSKIHSGWTNIHTWAEVFFPGTEWIEVEPSFGDNTKGVGIVCV